MLSDPKLLDTSLGRLEALEHGSLVWGMVDAGFSREQIALEFEKLISETGNSDIDREVEDLIEDLIDLRLLFELRSPNGKTVYRTRYAEGLRLFANLRQIFPNKPWQSAPSLVADYRVQLQPRRYPARNLDPAVILEKIQARHEFSAVARDVWRSLLTGDDGKPVLLAEFQARAAETLLTDDKTRGMIVTAGTGSGKTLAFYLPVLVGLSELAIPGRYWTKCLAVYPRVELLKDQFAETLSMCAKIAPALIQCGRRPLVVGTLFGDTPHSANFCSWHKVLGGRVCPYSKCPENDCSGNLLWKEDDLAAGRERLICDQCGRAIEGNAIILSRHSARRAPPDILFTTTEMLHKRIADTEYYRLLGIKQPKDHKPLYVLLDEVHTYTGITGAQSAMVIRRWRQASRANATFVGLSATLRNADAFFKQLTGLPEHQVKHETAGEHQMVEEGAEYQLVLQGDPVSQTSLLSTSIQSAMLLGRLLDPLHASVSDGRFGKRLFVFTDNLDVTNRLYDDLRDAEGFRFRRPGVLPLAAIRAGIKADESESETAIRNAQGQSWRALELVGHDLKSALQVGRTSSQDPGVTAGMNVIVATASLEVGFNDPGVGAVIQHKAPKSMAAFVQRKGRAGRLRRMRPWTVTILSDYGLDRLFFQNYDQLFDPVLPSQNLPIKNLYIVRMQAVAAFFDWLALNSPIRGWFWNALSSPQAAKIEDALLKYAVNMIKRLLRRDEGLLSSLSDYLSQALDLTEHELEAVLTEPPRSLLMEALPTLQRRIATHWQLIQGGKDIIIPYLPLPEFLPPNLFTELNLPEVTVEIENRQQLESLPVSRALKEVLPGKVTRRFAERRQGLSHWVPLDVFTALQKKQETGCNLIDMDYPFREFVQNYEALGSFMADGPGGQPKYAVYRPWKMKLREKADLQLSDASNAFLEWTTEIRALDTPLEFFPAWWSRWRGIVDSVSIHLHSASAPVTVRRFGASVEASLRRAGEDVSVRLRFLDEDGQPAGLGFELETDGLMIRYHLPLASELAESPMTDELRVSVRRAYFRDSVLNDPELGRQANFFRLDWLQQVYLTTLIAWAVRRKQNLKRAHRELRDQKTIKAYRRAMKIILGLRDPGSEENEDIDLHDENGGEIDDRLQAALNELLSKPEIIDRLHVLAERLYEPNAEELGIWLRSRLHQTFAQAIYYSCLHNSPKHASLENIIADAETPDSESSSAGIWITEDSMGGTGVIEALTEKFMSDPHLFFSGIEAAVAPSDRERVAFALERLVFLAANDSDVAEVMARMREAYLHEDRARERIRLHELLATKGLRPGKAASVALNSRLLRPGMNAQTDRILVEIIDWWDALHQQVGVAIGLREFCALAAMDEVIREKILVIAPVGAADAVEPASLLMGVLWSRREEIRDFALSSYHPFRQDRALANPRLVSELLLKRRMPTVNLSDSDWIKKLHKNLIDEGGCRLAADLDQGRDLAKAVAKAVAEPVDVGYLQFYPSVDRFEKDAAHLAVIFGLWEEL